MVAYDHFGTPSRRSYHNKEWADKMESLGLMPSSTGLPGGNRVGQKMDDYILKGGPIHMAIQKLQGGGFRLGWVDTMPAFRSARPAKIFDQAGIKVAVASASVIGSIVKAAVRSEGLAADSDEARLASMTYDVTDIQECIPTTNDFAGLDLESQLIEIELTPFPIAAKKPQTRVKYRCGCDNQVWGRPKLNLTCNDCNGQFTECS